MRRTGVIIGIDRQTTAKDVQEMAKLASEAFPTVKIALMSGANSVAFEYDDEQPSSTESPA